MASLGVPPAQQAAEVEIRLSGRPSPPPWFSETGIGTQNILWWQDHITERTQSWIRNLDKVFDFSEHKLLPGK